jgi:hypothetical protein
MKLYSIPAINWTWYIGAIEHDDGTVTIALHDRLHNHDDSHPDATPSGLRFKETTGRVAVGLTYSDGTERPLRNPGYVFGFPTF